jgi:hypothetical protein
MTRSYKKYQPEDLGTILVRARLAKNIGIDQASKDLGVAFKYLESLEHNNLSGLPGKEYVKKYLKAYCKYLHINFKECWKASQRLQAEIDKRNGIIQKGYLRAWPRFIRKALILLLVIAVLTFLAYKVGQIFTPPSLKILQPVDGFKTYDTQMKIVGASDKEAEIIINNESVFVDSNGFFETPIDLQKGLNLIKISAKKRYSQPREVEVRILLLETAKNN